MTSELTDTNFIDETEQKSSDMEELYNIDDDIIEEKQTIIKGKDRKSFPRMTRYEFVRIIGTRKQQLSLGAKPFIKNKDELTINEIVIEELKNKLIPYKIRRKMPNNILEEWEISELSIDHLELK